MAESQRSDWTATNICYLALMTFGYIFGEIAHFLINTTSKEVARGKNNCLNINRNCGLNLTNKSCGQIKKNKE